jgi:hypothetical protein
MVVTQRNFFFAYGPLQFIGNLGDFITAAPVNANDQISIARILGPLPYSPDCPDWSRVYLAALQF